MQESKRFYQSFQLIMDGIVYTVETCVITSNSCYLIHSVFKRENLAYVISLGKQFNTGWYTDIYRPISFEHSMFVSNLV